MNFVCFVINYEMCALFIAALSQLIHTMVTLVSHSNNLLQLVILDHCYY